ncbi:hypothetical protein RIR_jg429.t1 [Rhizophagus irregularis DAOM 181602=DAOM 197198]|nr:hypothetical protein RIR_jg429.t1 [Rhizophagus irregularis DAOM 181602=DAOM 197198]
MHCAILVQALYKVQISDFKYLDTWEYDGSYGLLGHGILTTWFFVVLLVSLDVKFQRFSKVSLEMGFQHVFSSFRVCRSSVPENDVDFDFFLLLGFGGSSIRLFGLLDVTIYISSSLFGCVRFCYNGSGRMEKEIRTIFFF